MYYLRLPKDIHKYRIFVLDATVATGAAAIMAIRVLLDHDVPEENISLCSLLMTEQGIIYVLISFFFGSIEASSLQDRAFWLDCRFHYVFSFV